MANVSNFPAFLNGKDCFDLSSDFPNFATGTDGWSSLATGSATVAISATLAGGVVVLTSGASANQDCMLRSTNPIFLPTAGRPIYCRSNFNASEAATNAMNIFTGFASSAAADLMVNAGAGMRTTGTIIGIYKVDGGTVWNAVTRNGSTVTTTASQTTNNMAASTYFDLEVFLEEFNTTTAVVTFKVNGDYLRDTTSFTNVIEHKILYSGLTIANYVPAYLKAGAGGTSEVVNVDYACGQGVR